MPACKNFRTLGLFPEYLDFFKGSISVEQGSIKQKSGGFRPLQVLLPIQRKNSNILFTEMPRVTNDICLSTCMNK